MYTGEKLFKQSSNVFQKNKAKARAASNKAFFRVLSCAESDLYSWLLYLCTHSQFTITHTFSNIVKNKFKLFLLATNLPASQLLYRLKWEITGSRASLIISKMVSE